ncbi:MAG: hypothetical protein V3S59_01525 [Alphaproteobacteria bacterium]
MSGAELLLLGVSAVGQIAAGQAASNAAKFQSAVLLQQAAREKEIAERDAEIFRREQNRLTAAHRAGRAASGVLPNEGTPLLVEDAILDETLLGEATIKQGGQVRATRLSEEAALTRFRGRAARTQGVFRAGTTLLTGFRDFRRFG